VRLVEVENLLPQQFEILPALLERIHVPDGFLGELVHLVELLVQRVERELLLRQLVALHEERLEALREAIDLLGEDDEALVLGGERLHPCLCIGDRALERAHALVERLELPLSDGQRAHLGAKRLEQRRRVALHLRSLALHFVIELGGGVHPLRRVRREPVDADDRFLGFRRLLHPLVELADLDVHRPDHLVDAIGFDDGTLHRLLLAFERFGLARDVLGEDVQPCEPLFSALAQLVELRERHELLLDVLHRRHCGRRVLARFAGGLADLAVVLRQRRGRRADLLQLGLDRSRLRRRLLDLAFRCPELAAKLFEQGALLFERVQRGLRLQRLGRQVLDRFAMFLKLAVRADRLLRGQLRLPRRVLQGLDALVDLLQLLPVFVERRDSLRDLVKLRRGARRLLHHLLERLADRRELGAARRQRGQHRAEGAALFARGDDEILQLVDLLLDLFVLAACHAPERVQHCFQLPSGYRRYV
jgi:hypothetical protein